VIQVFLIVYCFSTRPLLWECCDSLHNFYNQILFLCRCNIYINWDKYLNYRIHHQHCQWRGDNSLY